MEPDPKLPVILLEEVQVPKCKGNTNADLVQWVLDLQQALMEANTIIRTARHGLSSGAEKTVSETDL